MTESIKWGIIGCGDVTEVKSGPAFNKIAHSSLVAVMRRDAAKAADYAQRHGVPRWYAHANELIQDPEVNAVYIATPPSSHAMYALAAMRAGKPVYIEKPMTLNRIEAATIVQAAIEQQVKLVVAHYRRAQPLFKKVKELIDTGAIGKIRLANLRFYAPLLKEEEIVVEKNSWRLDPAISGGGLFHDLAPHQLDLAYYFFGPVEKITSCAVNQAGVYAADDLVTGSVQFKSGVVFTGSWCFSAASHTKEDVFEIIGSEGMLQFGVFSGIPISLTTDKGTELLNFEALQHVQQPMIAETVNYFLGQGANPCNGSDGVEVMKMLDALTRKV